MSTTAGTMQQGNGINIPEAISGFFKPKAKTEQTVQEISQVEENAKRTEKVAYMDNTAALLQKYYFKHGLPNFLSFLGKATIETKSERSGRYVTNDISPDHHLFAKLYAEKNDCRILENDLADQELLYDGILPERVFEKARNEYKLYKITSLDKDGTVLAKTGGNTRQQKQGLDQRTFKIFIAIEAILTIIVLAYYYHNEMIMTICLGRLAIMVVGRTVLSKDNVAKNSLLRNGIVLFSTSLAWLADTTLTMASFGKNLSERHNYWGTKRTDENFKEGDAHIERIKINAHLEATDPIRRNEIEKALALWEKAGYKVSLFLTDPWSDSGCYWYTKVEKNNTLFTVLIARNNKGNDLGLETGKMFIEESFSALKIAERLL